MSDIANDLPLLIVVASTCVTIDSILAAAAARLPGCLAGRATDFSSGRVTAASISALEFAGAVTQEPTVPSATTVLVAAPAQMALRLKAARTAAVTVALVDVDHLRLRALWRDPQRSPESEESDSLARHAGEFDYVIRLSPGGLPYLNPGPGDQRALEADTLAAIVQAERYRTSRQQTLLEQIRKAMIHTTSRLHGSVEPTSGGVE